MIDQYTFIILFVHLLHWIHKWNSWNSTSLNQRLYYMQRLVTNIYSVCKVKRLLHCSYALVPTHIPCDFPWVIPNWTGFGTGGSAGMIHNDSTLRSQSSDSLLYRNTASFAYHRTGAQRPFAEIKTIGVRTKINKWWILLYKRMLC